MSTAGDPRADEPRRISMTELYRQLDEQDLPGDPPFDVEAGLERLRGWMRTAAPDPATEEPGDG